MISCGRYESPKHWWEEDEKDGKDSSEDIRRTTSTEQKVDTLLQDMEEIKRHQKDVMKAVLELKTTVEERCPGPNF